MPALHRPLAHVIVGLALAALLAATAAASRSRAAPPPAASKSATIQQLSYGCHTWAGTSHVHTWEAGIGYVTQRVMLPAGGVVAVSNHDQVRHVLVQLSGPTKARTGSGELPAEGALLRYAAPVAVQLTLPGTYRFKTVEAAHSLRLVDPASDVARDLAAVPDNQLLLVVKVFSTIE